MFFKLFITTSIVFAASSFAADKEPQCSKRESVTKREIGFCFHNHSDSKDLLVFFPGVTNNERSWGNALSKSMIEEYAKRKIALPRALVISFGRLAFLADRPDTDDLQELSHEVSKLIREVKMQYGFERVLLLADSMGGFNSLQLYARRLDGLDKIALACPALSTISPFVSTKEWNSLGEKNGATPLFWSGFGTALRNDFKNDGNWGVSSPLLYLSREYRHHKKPKKIFLASVKSDMYGFTAMHQDLAERLEASGHEVERQSTDKMHCLVDAAPIVDYYLSE